MKPRKLIGCALMVFGVFIAISTQEIVFPWLERLVGIEAIVGARNVIYNPDGSYVFTNPGSIVRWLATVSTIGIAIALAGILVLTRSKKNENAPQNR
ncbi:MAG: hypothetical protein WCS94_11685 [Verrucomicrobiota bacterium]